MRLPGPPVLAGSGNTGGTSRQEPPLTAAIPADNVVREEPLTPLPHAADLPFTLSLQSMVRLATSMFSREALRAPAPRPIPLETATPAGSRWLAGVYTGSGATCTYKLYIPSHCRRRSLPLIVMLHGCSQSADDFAAGTRMNFLAETEGFLVVYPEQPASANELRCWNWFEASHQERDQGEPALIAGITRQIIAEHHVDRRRVYIAGLSAGGAMAAIMAAEYPDLYAAVGVHSGLTPGSAHDLPSALEAMRHGRRPPDAAAPRRPIPLILFQGDEDSTVHPRNADEFVRQWLADPTQPPATVRQGQVPDGRPYTCAVYHDLNGQTLVERWTVHGAEHAWSGGSSPGSFTDPAGPDASQQLVRFFREHPRAALRGSVLWRMTCSAAFSVFHPCSRKRTRAKGR